MKPKTDINKIFLFSKSNFNKYISIKHPIPINCVKSESDKGKKLILEIFQTNILLRINRHLNNQEYLMELG